MRSFFRRVRIEIACTEAADCRSQAIKIVETGRTSELVPDVQVSEIFLTIWSSVRACQTDSGPVLAIRSCCQYSTCTDKTSTKVTTVATDSTSFCPVLFGQLQFISARLCSTQLTFSPGAIMSMVLSV